MNGFRLAYRSLIAFLSYIPHIPDEPNPIIVVLVVVVDITIVEVHVPTVVGRVLRTRPIVIGVQPCHFISWEGSFPIGC